MRRIAAALLLWSLMFAPVSAIAQSRHSPQRDSWLGIDKLKHFFLSAFIESLTFSGLQAVGANRNTAFAGAITTTAGFALGKEIHDRKSYGLFSYRDLAWDAAGGGAAFVMLRSTQR
jgi:putative lipoprotein